MTSVLSADALATLSNLKDALGISSSDTSKDNQLERIINRTTLWIEGETNRKLKARRYNNAAATHTTTGVTDEDYVYFHGSTLDKGGQTVIDPRGYGIFQLPAYPVRTNAETGSVTFAVQALSNRDSSGETWDTALTENVDYIINRDTGELRLLSGPFTWGVHNYRVTMAAGFLSGSGQPYVPADLEELCLELAKVAYRDSRNVISESIGTWSRNFFKGTDGEFDHYIRQTIAKYSRFCF